MLRNHGAAAQEFRVTPRAPSRWSGPRGPLRVTVPARQERSVSFPVTARASGLGMVTADAAFGAGELHAWAEALEAVQ